LSSAFEVPRFSPGFILPAAYFNSLRECIISSANCFHCWLFLISASILFAALYTSCTVLLPSASTEHLCHCAMNKPRSLECPLPQSYVTSLSEPGTALP
jgi:hypothetical protein